MIGENHQWSDFSIILRKWSTDHFLHLIGNFWFWSSIIFNFDRAAVFAIGSSIIKLSLINYQPNIYSNSFSIFVQYCKHCFDSDSHLNWNLLYSRILLVMNFACLFIRIEFWNRQLKYKLNDSWSNHWAGKLLAVTRFLNFYYQSKIT